MQIVNIPTRHTKQDYENIWAVELIGCIIIFFVNKKYISLKYVDLNITQIGVQYRCSLWTLKGWKIISFMIVYGLIFLSLLTCVFNWKEIKIVVSYNRYKIVYPGKRYFLHQNDFLSVLSIWALRQKNNSANNGCKETWIIEKKVVNIS